MAIAKTEFIRFLGLDYTLRAKIYVEGYTEYGFLKEFFHDIHAIQIINLKGQFVEGKGIAFRESLQEARRLDLVGLTKKIQQHINRPINVGVHKLTPIYAG